MYQAEGKSKKNNVLDVLDNIKSSLFDGINWHWKDVPEKTIFERSLAERSKLRRQRLDEV